MVKLYEVEITIRTVVAAIDWDSALDYTLYNLTEIADGSKTSIDMINVIAEGCKLPSGWDDGTIPFGYSYDRTIKKIWEEQDGN